MTLEAPRSSDGASPGPIGEPPAAKNVPRWKVALISVLAIGGGTNGALSCLIWLANNPVAVRDFVAVSFLGALYVLGIWSGILWQSERGRGARLVRIFLAAQSPMLESKIVSFKLWAIGSYAVVFHPKSLAFDAGWYLGSDWELSLFHAVPDTTVGINLLSLGLISLLWGTNNGHPLIRQGSVDDSGPS
jgi:hypothetical protein